jgi:signal transduction histidine kinase
MQQPVPLASDLAERLRTAKKDLVARWLERITDRVALSRERVFPTEELLNHVPLLIEGIAAYLERVESDLNDAAPVVAKAMELGALRHAQGFDAYEILKEHEILGGVLYTFLDDVIDEQGVEGSARDLLACWQRIAHALELIRQATMTHFLRLSAERVNEREERLRRFNRMVSHELKSRVGAIRGAVALLSEAWIDEGERERFHGMIAENAAGLQRVLDDLTILSRIDTDARQRRNVLLPQAAAEAVRQLRGPAEARGVEVRIADDLPEAEVDAATVELCLLNYVSNAIKYSDPAKPERWVDVSAEWQPGTADQADGTLVVRVRDNGLGVPEQGRARLFEQFYRAHDDTVTGAEGTGLGLSIVRETVETVGGRAWAEFPPEGGSVFTLSLPGRRQADLAAAGARRGDGAAAR